MGDEETEPTGDVGVAEDNADKTIAVVELKMICDGEVSSPTPKVKKAKKTRATGNEKAKAGETLTDPVVVQSSDEDVKDNDREEILQWDRRRTRSTRSSTKKRSRAMRMLWLNLVVGRLKSCR